MWLFLIFLGVPMVEIALFIQVGGWIGLWPTLLIVVLTAIGGTAVMRHQGLQALARLQRSLEDGGDAVGPIAHGALILVAGMLLLTPGFFTDAVGLLLLLPPVRARLIAWGAARITVQAATVVQTSRGSSRPTRQTIEAEYEVLDPADPGERRGDSGWTRP